MGILADLLDQGAIDPSELVIVENNDLLEDPEINIAYLPDWVEKQIYRNIFSMMLSLLAHTLTTSHLEFLGHRVTFDVIPAPAVKTSASDDKGKEEEAADETPTSSENKEE